jgi:pyruvate kinase
VVDALAEAQKVERAVSTLGTVSRPRRLPRHLEHRRTRIVATIGPASDAPATLVAMAEAGMDVARVPLAHGSITEARERIRRIRAAAPEIGILADLPGPKVRAVAFGDGPTRLETGHVLDVVPGNTVTASTSERIGIDLDGVVELLEPGDRIAVGDGGIALEVLERTGSIARARVRAGGTTQGRPGLTVPAAKLPLETPTADDLERLAAVLEEGVEFVAVSFVTSAADLRAVRVAITDPRVMLMAKIETPEAITHLDEIVAECDAVMVARGDLGVRAPLEDIPHYQRAIIRSGVRFGRPVITATQMLESMVNAPVPTRAEVTDVANAVLDGSSAVMLSGETAIGIDPVNVVSTMARIVSRTERDFDYLAWGQSLAPQEIDGDASSPARITAATTGAAWRAAEEEDAAAIICCTRTGATARAVSRFRPDRAIVAATPSKFTARQLSLSWGVEPIVIEEVASTDEIVWFSVKHAVEAGYANPGDVVVVVTGSPSEPEPIADTVRIVRVR